jgi:hypothetical protein
MTHRGGRFAVAMATALVLVVSLGVVREAAAVATATGAGIRITDPKGGPVAQATVSLTFNGETKTAKTDDDGMVAIVFGKPGAAAPKGSVVLTGDGSGTVTYPGGPAGGEAFTVAAGVITMTPPAAAGTTTTSTTNAAPSGGGLSKGTKRAVGYGALATAAVVLLAGLGGGEETPAAAPTPAPTNVSHLFGNYNGTLVVGNSSINRCGQAQSVPVPVILSGNADGTGFTMNKGGLLFNGVMRPDGSFEAAFAGPINFPGLQNGTVVNWTQRGMVTGTQLSASGQLNVTAGNCNGAVIPTSVNGLRS